MILPAGILLVAALATLADWVWYTFGVSHGVVAGVLHGALLLSAVGGVLGAAARRPWRGLPIGMLAGIAGALAYFALERALGSTHGAAIPAAWVATWLALAVLEGRWLRAPKRRSWSELIARGSAAAGLGGLAFWLVLETLWGAPPAGGRNYGVQFSAWAFAWAPGVLALGWGGPRVRNTAPSRARGASEAGP